MSTLVVDKSPCIVAWKGCLETYTGAHYCRKRARHDGPHRCVCGAMKAKKSTPAAVQEGEADG